MGSFSQRHGYEIPDVEISIRHEAPVWLRELFIDAAYEAGAGPRCVRAILCKLLLESPDAGNWSEFPNIDSEARGLLQRAPWFCVYDLIETVYSELLASPPAAWNSQHASAAERFSEATNRILRKKGVGWQLVDGKIQVRGPEVFEEFVHKAVTMTEQSGRTIARNELKEALRDLSRRPEPEVTGAIQHSMAALECVAKDITGDPKLTLGEWLKKNSTIFPQPVGLAVDKMWGYASQYGRHVQEGKPADYTEAEFVVGLAGALTVYLLRKNSPAS